MVFTKKKYLFLIQYLYEFGWHLKGIIGITEPRRVAALTLAERVASEKGDILGGDIVGVRFKSFLF